MKNQPATTKAKYVRTKAVRGAWIQSEKKRYARLRWRQDDPGVYLGTCPDTATGLLELALQKKDHLTPFQLAKLLAADKSARW